MTQPAKLTALLLVAAVLLVGTLVATGSNSHGLPTFDPGVSYPTTVPYSAPVSTFDPFAGLPVPSLASPRPCPSASEAILRANASAPFILETTDPASGLTDAAIQPSRVSDDLSGISVNLGTPSGPPPSAGALGTVRIGQSAVFSVYQPDQDDALLMTLQAGQVSFRSGSGRMALADVTVRNGGLIVVWPAPGGQGTLDFSLSWTDGCRQFEGQASFAASIQP